MAQQHLKRIATPKSWKIKRKITTWITRPHPGPHTLSHSVSLNTAIKELIKNAKTTTEVKEILNSKQVLVDGKRKKDVKTPVGLMDVISFPDIKEHYRLLLSVKGTLIAMQIPAQEAAIKPCKIIGKTSIGKGTIQVNLADGRNIRMTKDATAYHVGDSLLITVPEQQVKEHYRQENGASVFLTGGNHVGETATLKEVKGDTISCSGQSGDFTTSKGYAFIVGKGKPGIKLTEK
ncbi:MAG TPA: 30S ribosomal protein S4e [Candidatus Nanoarchaeia archaeon]|nr:30S ribosomal protein S4e [Candidatus Nanoarchaeia archaeon]